MSWKKLPRTHDENGINLFDGGGTDYKARLGLWLARWDVVPKVERTCLRERCGFRGLLPLVYWKLESGGFWLCVWRFQFEAWHLRRRTSEELALELREFIASEAYAWSRSHNLELCGDCTRAGYTICPGQGPCFR